jgi:hypothetical protein
VFFQDAVNGEFGTNDFTKITVDALPLLGDQRRVIAFFVELRGFLEDLIGAEFNTKSAAFAAVFYNMQLPDRNGMGTGIQRQSPEFHPLLLYIGHKDSIYTLKWSELSI